MEFIDWWGTWVAALILWVALPVLGLWRLMLWGVTHRYRGTVNDSARPGGF